MSHTPVPLHYSVPKGYRITTPPPRNVIASYFAQQSTAAAPNFPPRHSFPPPTETTNIRRPSRSTLTLDSFTSDCSPGYIPVSKKRDRTPVYSSTPKKPRNSTEKQILFYSANHKILGALVPANCFPFQSPENTLRNIFNHAKQQLVNPRETRMVIFISDFKLEFDVQVDQVIGEMCKIIHYFETLGHVLTFSSLPSCNFM